MPELFDRSAQVRFKGTLIEDAGVFTFTRDSGPRIRIDAVRSLEVEPDKCTLQLFNLPPGVPEMLAENVRQLKLDLTSAQKNYQISDEERVRRIKLTLSQYLVEVSAGYADDLQMVFRGDPIEVRPNVRNGQDLVTEVVLGDAFTVLEEVHIAAQFGIAENPKNLLAFASALADLGGNVSEMEKKVSLVAPNAAAARQANGFIAVGRPVDTIRGITELLEVQWWVRNGKVEMVRRGEVLPDFAVLLDESKNLIRLGSVDGEGRRDFSSVLAPAVHPGRGVVFRNLKGEDQPGRVVQTHIVADTHGDDWRIEGIASTGTLVLGQVLSI